MGIQVEFTLDGTAYNLEADNGMEAATFVREVMWQAAKIRRDFTPASTQAISPLTELESLRKDIDKLAKAMSSFTSFPDWEPKQREEDWYDSRPYKLA
jgi:hypothetical protein